MNEPASLSDLVPDNEFSFIVVPSKRKKVVCFHYNTVIDNRIIGIYRTRRASPLYEIDLTNASRPMTTPPPTRRKDNPLMLPRTKGFDRLLDIGTSLSSIVGTGTTPVSDLERWPSSLWAHPAIFTECFCSSRETKADTVAHAVVALMDTIPDWKDEAWKLLVFLWAVEKASQHRVG
jgi:hypothetical protein